VGGVVRDICRLHLAIVVELVERDARFACEIYQRYAKEPESDECEIMWHQSCKPQPIAAPPHANARRAAPKIR